ncbi:MAG: formylmethanofuran dehydrogenase subunit B [Planctomycetaceae bacterium]|nr:formylmethanofuran dehydrogenase subunit B [Planctomycetaceae bacterium]
MASSPRSAELLAHDTASSGTPTSKGLAITLEPASADLRSPTAAKTAPAPTAPRPAGSAAAPLRVIDDAVCTACGCICDDIRLSVAPGEANIQQAEHACEIGRAWFTETLVETDSTRSSAAAAWIEGRPAGVDAALDRAVEILLRARNPLVYGLSETSCEAQRVAVELADLLRANLDTTTSTFHGPTVMALQAVGESTCTLGEIRDRADLVMLWGVNPLETDPRHYTRYSLMPAGRFVPRGRADRYCVVVDVRPTPTAGLADHALLIKPASDFEALATLRALAAGIEPDAEAVVVATGIELAEWREVFARMRSARYGVILYGTGVTQTRGKHLNCEALLALVSEMNRHTRFACKAMRGPGNVTGGDNVLTWRTGYPFGVNFARGFPRYSPGEYTAADLLARREVDAALIISSDPAPFFGPAALAHLAAIPTVVIDARATAARQQATVGLATAYSGLQSGGTVYRMDEIPLTLRPALPAARPSEVEWLENLVARIQARLGVGDGNSSDPIAVRGGA